MTVPPVVLHLGPHNVAEWLLYGALVLVVLGAVVAVARASAREGPTAGIRIRRRRR